MQIKEDPGRELLCELIKRNNLNKLVITADGSHTIYVPELDEHYHSVHGAVQESEFIFIKNGFEFCMADPVDILEIGFGTGLNVLLTAVKSLEGKRIVNYTSIEKYPLPETITGSLNHYLFAGIEGNDLYKLIHSSPWDKTLNICRNFNFKKIKEDFITLALEGMFDLIYFDAFGPDKQPEIWTKEIFTKISLSTKTGGIFVTYSAKGEVKRNLKACGFDVSLIPGPPGKRQIIRAVKK
jgi:tRNA U34 5-methylaminomethyl-2-thiouridine-forming methyltransferase MnmC